MQIWIDGDACPGKIKDIVFRAAIRTKTPVIIVANHFVATPHSPFIQKWQVTSGFDAADQKIIEHMHSNDLVITADIPLANQVVEKKGIALNPRGECYSENNIKQILALRNLNESLRSNGLLTGESSKLGTRDLHHFSSNLDKILAKQSRR